MADNELLSQLFELLFFLAFVKEIIKVIVQHGGIRVLCAVMEVDEYQQDAALMIKAVGMIDNVVSADEEFASIVVEKGGRGLLERLKSKHLGEPDLMRAISSTLLSMEAMMKRKEQVRIGCAFF
jgi:hypothetical protein